jgi:hypothetical protein
VVLLAVVASIIDHLTGSGEPVRWMVLDGAAIGDVDYTAALALTQIVGELRERHIRFVVSSMIVPVRRQLDRYGISAAMGHDAYYDTPGAALEPFHAARPPGGGRRPWPPLSAQRCDALLPSDALTSIRLGLAASDFGTVTVSTPSASWALTWSAWTSLGR